MPPNENNPGENSPKDKDPIETIASPAEFSKIPLDFVIASPLLTTIEAHKAAAQTTLEFVEKLGEADNMQFAFEEKTSDTSGKETSRNKNVSVPLLALTKVPSLNFDALSVNFRYNISQVITEKKKTTSKAQANIETKGVLSKFVGASLSGSVEHSSSRENTANRGGTLDVKVHVSESQLPAGLEKVINAMVENIELPSNPK